ncbi:MAG: hypothetical protein KUG82_05300 [Pseudomonadales bacterium]|nr:hypothetical protein [Pseudomonadales bacterium]
MIQYLSIFLASLFLVAGVSAQEIPSTREKGISVHALPKRVAKISGKPWGFEVSYAPYLKVELPYLQSIEDVLAYIGKQDKSVIDSGFWVVTSNPSAYDQQELDLHKQVKEVLPKKGIPLYWARGSELPNGFKRY